MKSLIHKEEDGTIKLTITLPFEKVKQAREEVLQEMAKEINLPGFRKGKAPAGLAESNFNPQVVRENVLKKILPASYMESLTEHNIKPIVSPKIHLEEASEDTDWVFSALTCELPNVDLGDYKKHVKAVNAKSKIAVSGKQVGEDEQQKPTMDQMVKAVLEGTKAHIPHILIEQETDRLLSQLLADVKKLGLSLDQYLGSTKRSPEDLRNEYAKRAEEDIKLEFVLQKIAETEKVVVDPKEVDEAIAKAKDPKEKENLEANRYLLTSILRQQKTLDLLTSL